MPWSRIRSTLSLQAAVLSVAALLLAPPVLLAARSAETAAVQDIAVSLAASVRPVSSAATPKALVVRSCTKANRWVTVPTTATTVRNGGTYSVTAKVIVGTCTDRRGTTLYAHTVRLATRDTATARLAPTTGAKVVRVTKGTTTVTTRATTTVRTKWNNTYRVNGSLVTSVSPKGVVTVQWRDIKQA